MISNKISQPTLVYVCSCLKETNLMNLFLGQHSERLDGQVSVQRAVWLDCVQDEPRPAQQQGPGGQLKGGLKNPNRRLLRRIHNYRIRPGTEVEPRSYFVTHFTTMCFSLFTGTWIIDAGSKMRLRWTHWAFTADHTWPQQYFQRVLYHLHVLLYCSTPVGNTLFLCTFIILLQNHSWN